MQNRSLTSLLSLLLAIFLVVGACSDSEVPVEEKPLTYTQVEENFVKKDCGDTLDSCLVISVAYPDFSGKQPLADSLNMLVEDFVLTGQQGEHFDGFEGLKAHYDTMYVGLLEDSELPVQPWTITTTAELILEYENFYSLEMHDSRYTGGAHGSYTTLLTTFDAEKMRSIRAPEILFQEGSYGTALDIFDQQFRESYEISSDESFSEAGFWFEEDQFALNNNIALAEKGIRVFYNHYEIAPYAAGTFDITVPYSDVKLILSEHFKQLADQK